MKRLSQLIESGTPAKEAVNQTLPKHKSLLERTMFDREGDNKPDQVDFMLLLQADAVTRKDGELLLLHVATKLVELDVIEAEGIEQWWDDEKSSENEGMVKAREKTKQLVDFLRESDDEDESEEEESDED
jgi:translation initiation factor eIF-2B subunit epsilon